MTVEKLTTARYELVKNDYGVEIYDHHEQRFLTLAVGTVHSVENIYIDRVEYVVGDDGKSLIPVPPEGGIFR